MRSDARNEKQIQNRVHKVYTRRIPNRTNRCQNTIGITIRIYIGCTRGQIRISISIIEYVNKSNKMQLNRWTNVYTNVLFWEIFCIWKIDYTFLSNIPFKERRIDENCCAPNNRTRIYLTLSSKFTSPQIFLFSKAKFLIEIWNVIRSSHHSRRHITEKCNDKWNPTANPNNSIRKLATISRIIYLYMFY